MKDKRLPIWILCMTTSILLITSCRQATTQTARGSAPSATQAPLTSNGGEGDIGNPFSPGVERLLASHYYPSTQAERDITPLAPNPHRVLYFVRPHATDPAIHQFLQDHYVMYNRTVPQNGKLFVFFPGTFQRPRDYQLLLNEAANLGYKVIGLEYPDATEDPAFSTVGQICRHDPDPSCADHVRQERLTGRDPWSKIVVTPANSIENRLLKLLLYLQWQHPDEHWDAFLQNQQIKWSQIAVGGHSQGAGFAAYIAKKYLVARVALWSGPTDYSQRAHQFATWMTDPGVTPISSYYGMLHQQEAAGRGPLAGWQVLGLAQFGAPVIATQTSTPYNHSHELVVTLPTQRGMTTRNAYHRSTAMDNATPLDANNQPAYKNEWDYIMGQ